MAATLPLPNQLAGTSVSIDSLPAPILAITFFDGYQQINVQVPWEVSVSPSLLVTVAQNGVSAQSSQPLSDYLTASVFFADANGYGIFQHASDYSRVTADNPAHRGEYVIGYGINLGPVSHTPATGAPAPFNPLAVSVAVPPVCSFTDNISWGAVDQPPIALATPSFVGLAPGTVGVYQINFQVPQSIPLADIPISFARLLQENAFGCPGFGSQTSILTKESPAVLLPVQ
jgi:uncharacterized protein (TIGR03437 family)